MSTNLQSDNNKSQQVRLKADTHKRMKIKAAELGCSLSLLLGEICEQFLTKENEPEQQKTIPDKQSEAHKET